MAILFTDGFDSYGTTTGTNILTRWTTSTAPNNISSTVTPYNYGQSFLIASSTDLSLSLGFNATSSFTVGFAYNGSGSSFFGTPGTATYCFCHLTSGGTYMIGLQRNLDGSLQVNRQTAVASGTSLGFTAPNIIKQGAWHYIELSVLISDTVGTVRLDVDGQTVLNLANQDTRNGTPTTVNTLSLGSNGSLSNNFYYDDLYLTDNTTPLGPQRIYTLRPNADTIEKDWSATSGWQFTRDISPISTSANATKGHIFTANQTTNLTGVEFYFGAVAQTVILGIAELSSVNPGTVTSVLYESAPVVRSATAGYYKFTFPAVTLNSGSIYGIYATRTDGTSTAILSMAAIASAPINLDPTGSLTYSGLINKADNAIAASDTLYASAPTTIWYMNLNYSTTNNYQGVQDTYDTDGDISYVTASNVGDYDLYDVESYPPASANIKAVNQIVWAKKTDATARTMTLTTKSGATTTDSSAVTLSTNYVGYSRVYETDPNTAAAWTVSGVNALQIGQKVAS